LLKNSDKTQRKAQEQSWTKMSLNRPFPICFFHTAFSVRRAV